MVESAFFLVQTKKKISFWAVKNGIHVAGTCLAFIWRQKKKKKGKKTLVSVQHSEKHHCTRLTGLMGEDGATELSANFDQGSTTENLSEEQSHHSWPEIHFEVTPYRTYHFLNQFRTPSNHNNFFKGVKW